jgi:hypothetical protein
MMMNDIEQYKNLVALLKEALSFYANQKNYDNGVREQSSLIDVDAGSQARFALNQIKIIEIALENQDIHTSNMSAEDIFKKLDELKNIN